MSRREEARVPFVELAAVGGVAASTLLFFGVFELGAAMPIPLPWYLAGFAVVWSTVGLAVWSRGRGGWRAPAVLGAVTSLALIILLVVPWTSRHRFLHHLDRVEVGMSREEARQVMLPYRPLDQDEPATGDTTDWYGHSRDARFNADFGIVRYEAGRVAAVEFSAD